MDNVRDFDNEGDGLNVTDIMALEPKMYEVRGHTVLGLLPDDVFPVVPQAVFLGADQQPQYVMTDQLVIALLGCVKDLQRRVLILED